MVREVNPTAPISRARYSAFTKQEIDARVSRTTSSPLDVNLAAAGASRQRHRPHLGRGAHALPHAR
jgi:DNA topoisomerase-1